MALGWIEMVVAVVVWWIKVVEWGSIGVVVGGWWVAKD